MKKKLGYLTILIMFCFFLCFLLKERNTTLEVAQESLTLWRENLFPSLFPFLALGEILIFLGLPNYLATLFEKPFQMLFHLNGKASFLLLMSMLSGFPSGPKYTKLLFEQNEISKEEANHLLQLVHFSNPLFVLSTVAFVLRDNNLTLCVLFSHIAANFVLAFLHRGKAQKKTCQNASFPVIFKKKVQDFSSFGLKVLDAIQSALSTMLFMLGSVTFFMLLATMCTKLVPNLYLKSFLTGILDLTSGIFRLQAPGIIPLMKGLMATVFLSFGGFSVHLQVLNVLKDSTLSYGIFMKGRIEATCLAVMIFLLLISIR